MKALVFAFYLLDTDISQFTEKHFRAAGIFNQHHTETLKHLKGGKVEGFFFISKEEHMLVTFFIYKNSALYLRM